MTEREMSYGTGGRGYRGRSDDYDERFDSPQTKASEYGEKAQQKASEFGQKAQQQADQGLDKAASATDRAATQLREKAMQQGGKTGEIGTKVADKLETTSDYLQQHDTTEILDDIEKFVRDHPLQAVGAAAFGGFVLARIIR